MLDSLEPLGCVAGLDTDPPFLPQCQRDGCGVADLARACRSAAQQPGRSLPCSTKDREPAGPKECLCATLRVRGIRVAERRLKPLLSFPELPARLPEQRERGDCVLRTRKL